MPPVTLRRLVRPGAGEDAGGDGGAVAGAADDRERAVARDFVEPLRQLARHDVLRARDVTGVPLVIGAHIEHVQP